MNLLKTLSRIKNISITYKITISILILSVTIFGIAFLYNYEVSKNLLLKNVEENTRNIVNSAVNKSEGFFLSVEKIAQNINYILEDRNFSESEIYELLRKIVGNNEEVSGSCLAFEPFEFDDNTAFYAPYCHKKEEEIFYSNLANSDYDYPLWDWYQIPKMLGRAVWSEPYYDEGGGNMLMTTYSVPLYDPETNELKAVFTLDLSLEWLNELVSSIKIFDSGYAFLLSRNGTIITHPHTEYIMNESIFSLAAEHDYPHLREIGQKMINSEQGFIKIDSVLYNGISWVYYAPLSNNNWSIGFIFPEKELYSDLNELTISITIIILTGIAITTVVIFLITKRLTKPIIKLSKLTEEIGKGNLDVQLPESQSKDEVGKLRDSFSQMQDSLKQYIKNLEITLSEKKRMETELNISRDIQLGFIPTDFSLKRHSEKIQVYGSMEPAKEVGGDLYDFFFLDENRICLVIGDVSGKGIPAALFMAVTTSLLNEYRDSDNQDITVDKIAQRLNRNLYARNPENYFVTMFICTFNVNTGELEYCNCGHNKSYIISNDGTLKTLDEVHGIPLGVAPMDYGLSGKIVLQPEDKVFLYTDGIVEAFNENGELYAEDKLETQLKKTGFSELKEMIKSISKNIAEFAGNEPQSDDITMLALSYIPDGKVNEND